jgi:hypothetical protein
MTAYEMMDLQMTRFDAPAGNWLLLITLFFLHLVVVAAYLTAAY